MIIMVEGADGRVSFQQRLEPNTSLLDAARMTLNIMDFTMVNSDFIIRNLVLSQEYQISNYYDIGTPSQESRDNDNDNP